jgi:hypothetical protein
MDYLFKPGSMLGLFADVAEDFIVSDHRHLKTFFIARKSLPMFRFL